jgi:hypothetical protein
MRALRTHIRQGRAIGCGIALLISLATACSSSGSQASDSTTPTDLGAPCADASTCTSNKCQALAANDRNIPGLCSALCTSPKGCGPSGACVAETVSGDNVCLRSCASPSDCHPGIPCIWDSAVDGGVCVPVPSGICANFGLEGGWKLEQACKTVCMGPLSNAPAQALSACAASSCASICR